MAAHPQSSFPEAGPPSSGAAERGYYSLAEAAALLGVSRMSVWRWVRAGRLPAVRLGPRSTRIEREDLERVLSQVESNGSRSWLAHQREAEQGVVFGRVVWRETGEPEHVVQFYEADAFLIDVVADLIGEALRTGEAGVVVATEAHRRDIDERLRADGLAVEAARAAGQYVALDAAETLSRFMVDGAPDAGRFAEVIGGVISRAAAGGRRVRAFGEMVALMALEGDYAGALRLEQLWNDLRQTHHFSLLCAYPIARLAGDALAELLGDVCTEHSHVIPAESYAALDDPDDRLRTIALLQQKAASLEVEIAERKRAERVREALLTREREARDQAEAALRLRDEFLSIASHELRTPLATLLGHVQLTRRRIERDGQLEPERVLQVMQTIKEQAGKLSRLVDRLLDVSRLEAGKLALERQPTDLTALVEQAVAGARARSDRHPIGLEAPSSLEAEVDALRLEQVLTNLLDNAIKYSPDGGQIDVALRAGVGRWEAGVWEPTHPNSQLPSPSSLEISVRDHGIGIPPERRGQIFERFYQAHNARQGSGMGLGLYISRQIVELHGGELAVGFPEDGGTRFTVYLPFASTSRTSAPADRAVQDAVSASVPDALRPV